MLKLFDSATMLAAEVVRVEPYFATDEGAIENWLATCASPAAKFPPKLIAARKAATAAIWSAGLAEWNRRAVERLALLRRLPANPPLILALMELFSADFSNSLLPSGLDAAGALFPGHLLLERAELQGPLSLEGASCLASVFAEGAAIAGDLAADQAQFTGPANFGAMRVGRAARFASAAFLSDAVFDDAVVQRELWMRKARFGGAFRMERAELRDDASLGAVYCGPSRFDQTHFADTVSFEGATFNGPLSLDGCRFDGLVLAQDVRPLGDVSSVGTAFGRGVRPSGDWLRKGVTVHDMFARVQKALSP